MPFDVFNFAEYIQQEAQGLAKESIFRVESSSCQPPTRRTMGTFVGSAPVGSNIRPVRRLGNWAWQINVHADRHEHHEFHHEISCNIMISSTLRTRHLSKRALYTVWFNPIHPLFSSLSKDVNMRGPSSIVIFSISTLIRAVQG